MKTFACDICGKSTTDFELRTLYENIQQEHIKELCKECYKDLVDATLKIDTALKEVRMSWIQKVINKMVNRNEN